MRRLLPYTLPILLGLSWTLAIHAMWRGLTTVPSGERLAVSHMVRIPTVQSFAWHVGTSALELAVALALAWPGPRLLLRLWIAALAAVSWFIFSTPLGLNTVQWAHRRWLAALALWLLVTALTAGITALVRRLR